jgi:hypothetical protein
MSRAQAGMNPADQSCFIYYNDIDTIIIQISLQMYPWLIDIPTFHKTV